MGIPPEDIKAAASFLDAQERPPLTDEEVMERFGKCRVCETDLFEIWGMDTAMRYISDLNEMWVRGIDPKMPAACPQCSRKIRRDRAVADFHNALESKRKAGDLMEDYVPYMTPHPLAYEQNPEAWRVAKEWKYADGNIWAYGPEGVGKTAMLRWMMARKWRAQYIAKEGRFAMTGPGFVEVMAADFHDVYRNAKKSELEKLDRLCRVPVLLIDDIANVCWERWSATRLFRVVNMRFQSGLRTHVTSAMTIAAFHDVIRECWPQNESFAMQLCRRLRPYKELPMDGESLREKLIHYKGSGDSPESEQKG